MYLHVLEITKNIYFFEEVNIEYSWRYKQYMNMRKAKSYTFVSIASDSKFEKVSLLLADCSIYFLIVKFKMNEFMYHTSWLDRLTEFRQVSSHWVDCEITI